MKRILLLIGIIILLSFEAKSQSIRLLNEQENEDITGDTVTVQYEPGDDHGYTEISIFIHVKNTSSKSMEMCVKKTEFNIANDEFHSFCFAGYCYDSSRFVSQYTSIVDPDSIDVSFSGHYRFDDLLHKPTVSLVAYTFYDVSNPSDSAIVYVKYRTLLPDGIDEYTCCSTGLFQAKPDPAYDNVSINYQLNMFQNGKTRLVVSNIMNPNVMEQQITENNGEINLDVSKWLPGVYFYSIIVGKDVIKTNKLVVIH
jgi:hypothetical protein